MYGGDYSLYVDLRVVTVVTKTEYIPLELCTSNG